MIQIPVKLISLLLAVALFSSCATMSNRTKTILAMSAAAIAGGIAGSAASPDADSRLPNAALGAGIGGATMGVVGLFVFDEETKSKEYLRQVDVLKAENASLRGEFAGLPSQELDAGSNFKKDLPEEYKKLIRPGAWSVYKINQWSSAGENTLIHQDKMIRLIPPQIAPQAMGESQNSKQPKQTETKGEKNGT